MKSFYSILIILLVIAIVKSSYLTDITVLSCPYDINTVACKNHQSNCLGNCRNILDGDKVPDINWEVLYVNFNKFDEYSFNQDYRYFAYKTNENNQNNAYLSLSIVNDINNKDIIKDKECYDDPIKEIPSTMLYQENKKFYLCYTRDENKTPSSATQVLLQLYLNETISLNPTADGFSVASSDLNDKNPIDYGSTTIDDETMGMEINPDNLNTNDNGTNNNFETPNLNGGNGGIINNNNNNNNNNNDFQFYGNNNNNNGIQFYGNNNNDDGIQFYGNFKKRQSLSPLYLVLKIGYPGVATKNAIQETTQPTEENKKEPEIKSNDNSNNNKEKENNNNSIPGITKAIVIISVVAITGVISLLVFMYVNRRHNSNEEKEEQYYNNLPWKVNSVNSANNSYIDPIYNSASLPQIENALNKGDTSFSRNNNQGFGTMSNVGFNAMNTIASRSTMNSRAGTMHSINSNTLNSRAGTMHSMNSMNTINSRNGTINSLRNGPPQPMQYNMNNMNNMNMNMNMNNMNMNNMNMNNMNMNMNMNNMNMNNMNMNNMNMNMNMNMNNMNNINDINNMNNINSGMYNQNYQSPPNGLGFINQQNINLPPMSAPSINAGLNITLSTSPLSNISDNNQNISPGTTFAPPNYNPNYQPTIPLESVNNNYETQQNINTTNEQHSMQNIDSQGNNHSNDVTKNNSHNVKKTLYVTNQDPYIENDDESEIQKIDDEHQELLRSSKLAAAEEQEETDLNQNNKIINESSLNLPSNLQIIDGFDNSLNLTPIEPKTVSFQEGSYINNSLNEHNIIDPKRLSIRNSTANGVNQLSKSSITNDCDPDIPVSAGYDARELDELTLQFGDKITVKAVYTDGWGFGINNSTKEEGVFPLVCLARKPNLVPTE